jgi:hypothetical protein
MLLWVERPITDQRSVMRKTMRAALGTALTMLLATTAIAAAPTAAEANPTIRTFQNVATQRCLAGATIFDCTPSLTWRMWHDGLAFELYWDGGYCLDSNAHGQVYLLGCNDANYQRWYITWTPAAGGSLEIKNVATLLCLDTDGRRVYTLACNGANYQRWT